MKEPLQAEALLLALAEVAVEVHHARTVEGIVRAAGEGLRRFDISVAIVEYREDDLLLRHYNGEVPEALREVLGPAPWVVGRRTPARRELPLHASEDAGRPLYFPDLTGKLSEHYQSIFGDSAPMVLAGLQALGFSSTVIAPVSVLGEPWGGLLVTREGLSVDDVPAMGLFALQFGSALEGAESIARLEARNRELELVHELAKLGPRHGVDDMVRVALASLATGTQSDVAALHRYDRDRDEYVMVPHVLGYQGPLLQEFRRFKLAEWMVGLQGAVAIRARDLPENRKRLVEEGLEHLALVPLHVEGRPMGLMTFSRTRDVAYREVDLRLAERMGGQVAAALERAELHEESARRVQQLSLLYDVARSGVANSDVETLVGRVLEHMIALFPADITTVHELDGERLRLTGWRRRGPGPHDPPTPPFLPVAVDSVVGLVALGRKTVARSDASLPPFSRANALRLGFDQLMSTPLETGGRLLGTLSVARKGDEFSPEEHKLLESVAAQLTVLMEQSRLYSDLRRSYEELSRTQAELVRHERLAALGELSAVMAHEVRNPLGVIFNSLTSLRKLVRPSADVDLLLNIVGEEADRLNRIVSDLLDFARPHALQARPVELRALLCGAADAATQARGAEKVIVAVLQEGDVPPVHADAQLLRQAMVNLVVNAMQAMPRGGKVTVSADVEHGAEQRWARVRVHDEGPGMTPAVAERVFQPFFTTKATGTGLGLAIVKRIIEEHHGDVSVSSDGRGSTFVVRLPLGPP